MSTIVTIELEPEATYNISADETITVTIPATALTAAGQVVAAPWFDISYTPPPASTIPLQGVSITGGEYN